MSTHSMVLRSCNDRERRAKQRERQRQVCNAPKHRSASACISCSGVKPHAFLLSCGHTAYCGPCLASMSTAGTCSVTCEVGVPHRAFLPVGTVAHLLLTSHPHFVRCSVERFRALELLLPKTDRYHVSEMFYSRVEYWLRAYPGTLFDVEQTHTLLRRSEAVYDPDNRYRLVNMLVGLCLTPWDVDVRLGTHGVCYNGFFGECPRLETAIAHAGRTRARVLQREFLEFNT